MAIATFDELKQVLDYIKTQDPYIWGNLNLYIADNEKNGIVYSYVEKQDKQDVIVIKDIKVVIGEKVYTLPAIKSCIVEDDDIENEAKEYNKFLAAYIDYDLLVRNMCMALGVILDENISDTNPDMWLELITIARQYFNGHEADEQMPYGAYRRMENTYKTYVPGYLIYKIAVYLNRIGVFDSTITNDEDTLICVGIPYQYETLTKAGLVNKINRDIDKIATLDAVNVGLKQCLVNIVNSFDIPYNSDLIGVTISCNNQQGSISLYSFKNDGDINIQYSGEPTRLGVVTSSSYFHSLQVLRTKNDIYNLYQGTFRYNASAEEPYTYSTNGGTYEQEGDTTKNLFYSPFNINNYIIDTNIDNNIKYGTYISVGTTSNYSTGFWGVNVFHKITDLKQLSITDFIKTQSMGAGVLNDIVNNFGVDYDREKDFIVYTTDRENYNGRGGMLYVIRDATSIKQITGTGYAGYTPYIPFSYDKEQSKYSWDGIFLGASKLRLEFKSSAIVDAYGFDGENYFRHSEQGERYLEITSEGTYGALHKYIRFGIGTYEKVKRIKGYTFEDGSVLPIGISTIEDFLALYHDWSSEIVKTYNPLYIDGDLKTSISFEWLPLSTIEASTQAEAQAGYIDEDNFEAIIDDIYKVSDDLPEDEDADDDSKGKGNKDSKVKKNKGNTPGIPDADDLVSIISTGDPYGIKIWSMPIANLGNIFRGFYALDDIKTIIQNLFGNPIDLCLSCQLCYLDTTDSDETYQVRVGPYDLSTSDGPVVSKLCVNQYVTVDSGTINIKALYKDYRDFTETTADIYLPFVGTQQIDLNPFVEGSMKIKLNVDVLSGKGVYFIQLVKDGVVQTLYQFSATVMQQIPLTSTNWARMIGDIIKTSANAIGGLASMDATSIPNKALEIGSIAVPKPSASYSGNIEANIGIMCSKTPYLTIHRHRDYDAKNLETLIGYASNYYTKLSTLKAGYVKIKYIHVESGLMTQREKERLETKLKSGIHI